MTFPERAPCVAMLRHTLFRTSEVFIPDQASKLASSVTLIARDKIFNARSDLDAVSFAASPASRIAYTFGFSAPLDRCLRMLGANILHAHFGIDGLYSVASARRLEVPHVTTLHGSDVALTRKALLAAHKPVLARYALGREEFLRNRTTTFVCVSRHVQRLAIELGADPEHTVVIPTGVDTSTIVPDDAPDSPNLVHVARLVDVKGTATLIRAMARVVMLVPDAHLRIVGDGPLRRSLGVLAEQLDISDSVTFVGAVAHSAVLARSGQHKCLWHQARQCLPVRERA